jgi:glycerol-3-phosphate acyltransferase PlsY
VLSIAIAALFGYALGSIATGVMISRRAGTDIRQHGSGSTGGTNITRTLGLQAGLVVIAADAAKGYLAVLLVSVIGPDPAGIGNEGLQLVAGLAAITGHIWPAFAQFRGGKGVATSAGVLLALAPAALVAAIAIFAIVLATKRVVSLASMIALLSVPLVLSALRWTETRPVSVGLFIYSIVAAALIAFAHRENIARLRAGTEPHL